MKFTYQCSAKNFNCDFKSNTQPKVLIEQLIASFNEVRIIDNSTGEILFDYYISSELAKPVDDTFDILITIQELAKLSK